jgi:transposase
MKCKECGATYAYEYGFIQGKERYTKAYKLEAYRLAIGSTIQHASQIMETPYSTLERFVKSIIMRLAPYTKEYVERKAAETAKLILGIDDFAIRKGHNYNTGLHDLRGESMLGVITGRTLPELRSYMAKNPQVAALKPYAVVMDLARYYHTFVTEFFPNAIRIADRFHVNGYIIDALNETRRRISRTLAPQAKKNLRLNKHLLNKRNETLTEKQQQVLNQLLAYSSDLKAVYELKEQLAEWYDCSPNYELAVSHFQRWLTDGHKLNIPEVETALKTFENWKEEITNYHRCRFTNGIVEGRNGKIKSLQRRRFFVRNRTYYEALIMLECNKEVAMQELWQIAS